MDRADIPSSRSDWAELDWKDAQSHVGQYLKLSGYTMVEEMHFDDHKRADVVVYRQYADRMIFGIVEVKCYSKVSQSLERSAMEQALGYLESLYSQVNLQKRWSTKKKSFFAAIVFTKDYPAIDRHEISFYQNRINEELYVEHPVLISTTPDSLLKRLSHHFPAHNTQTSLDDFY
ncbi:MAG: hypothetical protein ACXAE3_11930 [Candidatus Kariarchaeaceae archaeon]|jgi:hypothetical protein